MKKKLVDGVGILALLLITTLGCAITRNLPSPTEIPAMIPTEAEEGIILSPEPTYSTDLDDAGIYRANLARTGVFEGPGPTSAPALAWKTQLEGLSASSAILAGRRLYVGTANGVAALNSQNGTVIWTYTAEGGVSSAPALQDDTLYFGSKEGVFYALDINSVTPRWTFLTAAGIFGSPAVDKDKVYFGSMDGVFYALDAANGQELWRFELPNSAGAAEGIQKGLASTPAVAGDKVVFVSSQSGGASAELYIYAVEKETGLELWESTTWNQATSPAIADEAAYFGGFGTLFGLRLADGTSAFEFNTDIVLTPLAVAGGVIYFGCENGYLYAVDLSTAQEKWSFNAQAPIRSGPSVSGTSLYFGSDSGAFYALDISTGQVMWSYETGTPITGSALISDGLVYFSTINGNVYALK